MTEVQGQYNQVSTYYLNLLLIGFGFRDRKQNLTNLYMTSLTRLLYLEPVPLKIQVSVPLSLKCRSCIVKKRLTYSVFENCVKYIKYCLPINL